MNKEKRFRERKKVENDRREGGKREKQKEMEKIIMKEEKENGEQKGWKQKREKDEGVKQGKDKKSDGER
jgi:hypothetical protein